MVRLRVISTLRLVDETRVTVEIGDDGEMPLVRTFKYDPAIPPAALQRQLDAILSDEVARRMIPQLPPEGTP